MLHLYTNMGLTSIVDKCFWFGNGRFLGIQHGTVEQRIQDSYYSDIKLVKRYLMPLKTKQPKQAPIDEWFYKQISKLFPKQLWEGTQEQREQIRQGLIEKINNGTADKKLIPFLDKKVGEYFGKNKRVQDRSSYAIQEIESSIQFPLSVSYFYNELITGATTLESIPYLLQSLNSSVIARDELSIRTEPEKFIKRYKKVESEITGRPLIQYDYYDTEYELFETTFHHRAVMPFAELAKSMLSKLLIQTGDKETISTIKCSIDQFDTTKTQEIAHTVKYPHIVSREYSHTS
jgi:hypothetical protein